MVRVEVGVTLRLSCRVAVAARVKVDIKVRATSKVRGRIQLRAQISEFEPGWIMRPWWLWQELQRAVRAGASYRARARVWVKARVSKCFE